MNWEIFIIFTQSVFIVSFIENAFSIIGHF